MNSLTTQIYYSPDIPLQVQKADVAIRSKAFGKGQEEKDPDILFCVEKNREIIAVGNLRKLNLQIGNDNISLYGLGGVVSTQKNIGLGKILIREIKNFLDKNKLISVGICNRNNSIFYEKCGFEIYPNLAKRLYVSNKLNPDGDEDIIVYPKQNIFEKIEKDSSLSIYAPFWW